jgi:predicted RNA-binding protein YlqC (UPF0109 family)
LNISLNPWFDDPGAVTVNEVEGEKATILELRVAPADIGKVITANTVASRRPMRTVLSASSGKSGKRVFLEILD